MEFFILQASGAGSIVGYLPLILMALVIYFFFIRPQSKKQKEQNTFVTGMEKGDEIVTASGIVGKINKIDDRIVTIQVDSKTFLKVAKTSISKEMTDSVLNAKADDKGK